MWKRWFSTACLFVTFLASIPSAKADCAAGAVWFSPRTKAKQVPRNVKILVHLYGNERAFYSKAYQHAELVHRHHRVPLRATTLPHAKQSFLMKYMLLTPTKPLLPGTTYVLQLNETGQKLMKVGKRQWLKTYQFTTSKTMDNEAPKGKPQVTQAKYTHQMFGCGPARRISMTVKGVKDHSGLRYWIDATWQGKNSKEHVRILSTQPSLGHGMCSGNFKEWSNGEYTLRITPVDLAGNKGQTSKPITVSVKQRW